MKLIDMDNTTGIALGLFKLRYDLIKNDPEHIQEAKELKEILSRYRWHL